MSVRSKNQGGFRITGWHVLGALLAFFGAVMVVNVAMVWAALSTFGGAESRSSYKAGLEFAREMERAGEQSALAWSVDASVTGTTGARQLTVEARDQTGEPVAGLDAHAAFAHLADSRRDRAAELVETTPGRYVGAIDLPDGVWTLNLELGIDGTVRYRSRNRVNVR